MNRKPVFIITTEVQNISPTSLLKQFPIVNTVIGKKKFKYKVIQPVYDNQCPRLKICNFLKYKTVVLEIIL